MQVTPASNRDFSEFRHGFFPFRKTNPHLIWPQLARNSGKIEGLVVRTEEDVLIGISLYEVSDGLLLVSEFTSFPLSIQVGNLLAEGLRDVAARKRLDLIWFSDDQGRFTESFVAECGFQLMAYYEHDPKNLNAGRINHWRLPRVEART